MMYLLFNHNFVLLIIFNPNYVIVTKDWEKLKINKIRLKK